MRGRGGVIYPFRVLSVSSHGLVSSLIVKNGQYLLWKTCSPNQTTLTKADGHRKMQMMICRKRINSAVAAIFTEPDCLLTMLSTSEKTQHINYQVLESATYYPKGDFVT